MNYYRAQGSNLMGRISRIVGACYICVSLKSVGAGGFLDWMLHCTVPGTALLVLLLPPPVCLLVSYGLVRRGRYGVAGVPLLIFWLIQLHPLVQFGVCGTCHAVMGVHYGW